MILAMVPNTLPLLTAAPLAVGCQESVLLAVRLTTFCAMQ